MRETFERDDCGRAGQLVGYLYDESAAAERADFERHLRDCAACREEVSAFTYVRGSVAQFRAELLQAAPPVSLDEFAADTNARPASAQSTVAQPTTAPPTDARAPHASPLAGTDSRAPLIGFASPAAEARPSASAARAALREFFRLSPAWLRASTVAAALALCALALLAVVNAEISFVGERYALRTGVRPAAAPFAEASPPAQTKELTALRTQLKSLAAERDAAVRELEATREELDDSRAVNLVAAEFEAEPAALRDATPTRDEQRRTRRAPPAAAKSGSPSRGARRRAEDEDLPRLLDLLGDAN